MSTLADLNGFSRPRYSTRSPLLTSQISECLMCLIATEHLNTVFLYSIYLLWARQPMGIQSSPFC